MGYDHLSDKGNWHFDSYIQHVTLGSPIKGPLRETHKGNFNLCIMQNTRFSKCTNRTF